MSHDFASLGVIAYQQKKFDKAVALIGRAIALNPRNPALYINRGAALHALNKREAALADFDKAIALKPDFAEAYYDRGNILRELEKLDAAVANYDKAIAVRPDNADTYYNRGNTLRALRKLDSALVDYGKAIALQPDFAAAYYNRALTYQELKRLDAAIADYDKVLALRPNFAPAYGGRGNALHDLRNLDAAIADYDKAISLEPDYASPHWNKALTLLVRGDLEAGFKLFEWRWKNRDLELEPRGYSQPLWLGEEPLRGKRILLHCEQGLGDTIQFCRYASLVARAGAEVILGAPRSLAELLKNLEGVSRILIHGDRLPDFDYHCPLLSLPLAFKTVLETIPDPTPYLHADPVKASEWRERIGEKNRLKVGVVWSGGFRPDFKLWDVNERRNVRLDDLARALSPIDAEFYSLQKGDPAESEIRGRELEYWPRGNFHNFAGDLNDFSDTAALVANLDLVVSVDTSTAHLAAALGKPTWILNRFDTCWRWLLDRDDSPWYRSVRLYRQDESRSWAPVLERVAADLTKLAVAANPS